MGENPTGDEFEGWLRPSQALAILGSGILGYQRVRLWAGSGLVRAAALHVVIVRSQSIERRTISLLPMGVWDSPDTNFDGRLWRDGDMTLHHQYHEHRYLDVRFNPADIAQLIPTRAPEEATAGIPFELRRGAAPTTAEVDAWYGALPPTEKAYGYRKLLLLAKAALGDGVVRKQIEAFCKGRPSGPKTKPR